MDEVTDPGQKLSIREMIARARVHLLENTRVTLRLSFASHNGKLSGRVKWCISKKQSSPKTAEGTTEPDKIQETVDDILEEALKEIKAYHRRRRFGTAAAVIERQGDEVRHTETEYDERVLGWTDEWGKPRFRVKRSQDEG